MNTTQIQQYLTAKLKTTKFKSNEWWKIYKAVKSKNPISKVNAALKYGLKLKIIIEQ